VAAQHLQAVTDGRLPRPRTGRSATTVLVEVQHHVDDELTFGIPPLPHGVGPHRAAHALVELPPRLVPRGAGGVLLVEERAQVELGPVRRRNDQLDAHVEWVAGDAESCHPRTGEGETAEGGSEVLDPDDLGTEAAERAGWHGDS